MQVTAETSYTFNSGPPHEAGRLRDTTIPSETGGISANVREISDKPIILINKHTITVDHVDVWPFAKQLTHHCECVWKKIVIRA
jgi:hypothetical protein